MKKLRYLLLALMICASLAACGGPDKKPATEAYNRAKDAFNEVSAIINQDISAYDDEFVDEMIDLANLLNEVKDKLNGNDLDQETLDLLVEWCGTIEEWSTNVKATLE